MRCRREKKRKKLEKRFVFLFSILEVETILVLAVIIGQFLFRNAEGIWQEQ